MGWDIGIHFPVPELNDSQAEWSCNQQCAIQIRQYNDVLAACYHASSLEINVFTSHQATFLNISILPCPPGFIISLRPTLWLLYHVLHESCTILSMELAILLIWNMNACMYKSGMLYSIHALTV